MQRAVHCNFCFAHRQLLQLPTVHRHHPTGICQQSNRCKLGRVPFLRASLPLFLIFPLSGSFVLTAGQANLGPATLLTLIASRGKRALRPTEREKNANTRKVPRSTMASSPMDSRAKSDYRGGKTREGETQKKNTAGLSLLSPDANSTKQKKNGVASVQRVQFTSEKKCRKSSRSDPRWKSTIRHKCSGEHKNRRPFQRGSRPILGLDGDNHIIETYSRFKKNSRLGFGATYPAAALG